MLYHPIPRRVYLWRRLLAALTLSLVLASLAAQVAQAQASVRYVNSAIDDGLVASWSFDASEGGEFRDVAHLPKRGNFGTLSGSAVLDNSDKPDIGGLNPAALTLDGGDGMGLVADTTGQLNLANAFTLVGWVKRTVDDGPGVLYSSGTSAGAWYVGFGQDGRLILGADAQILASSTNALPIAQWVRVFVAKEAGGNVRFYFGGVAAGQGQTGALQQPSGNKSIGGRPADAAAAWQGRVDALSVYNRALTDAEIARLSSGAGCVTDGLSWATAFRDVTCALELAPGSSEIWIARGIYVPGILSDSAYQMRNAVDLYGGFVGTETSRSQRPAFVQPTSINPDPAAYTILSGDVNGDDNRATFVQYEDNTNHVIKGDGVPIPTLLDGLVVMSGNADSTVEENAIGGGLVNNGGNLSLSNMAFIANGAGKGGGIAQFNADLRLSNVTFLGDRAVLTGGGGGIYAEGSSIDLSGVRFTQNAAIDGAGATIKSGTAVINGSQFSGNVANQRGGALLVLAAANVRLTAVEFNHNSAQFGGAVAAEGSSLAFSTANWRGNTATNGGGLHGISASMQLTGTSFITNTATLGGGIYRQGGNVSLAEVTLEGNQATQNGGAIYNQGGDSVTINRLFAFANTSGGSGGAIFNTGTTNVAMYNLLLVGNGAQNGAALANQDAAFVVSNATAVNNTSTGGATISGSGASSGSIRNTVTWSNSASQPINAPAAVTTQNNHLEGSGGDPKFVRMPGAGDGNWATLANNDYGELSVQSGSPLVDAGTNSALPPTITTDVKGSSRFWDDLSKQPNAVGGELPPVDIGAHEYINAVAVAKANGPYSGVEGTAVTLSAQGSSASSGTIVKYEWDCRDDGSFEITGTAVTAACAYEDDGTYTARLRVTAAVGGVTGGTADATAVVVIADLAPVYTPPSSQLVQPGTERAFELGSFVDGGVNDKWKVEIDWGDGTQGSNFDADEQGKLRTASHAYAAPGQYAVRVSVRDNDGGVTGGGFTVTVSLASADSDGDGVLDVNECTPEGICPDTDGDGQPDYLDTDDDNDGIPTSVEGTRDTDGDGIPDARDPDDDNDSLLTVNEGTGDLDGDGKPDYLDPDDDGDGRPTIVEHGRDDNANGVPDEHEVSYIVMMPLIQR